MLQIDLTGKKALVTGANSGIGQAVAMALAHAGADVAINYLARPEDAEAVTADISKLGRKALALQADVSDPDAVENMFSALDTQWNGIDLLVNNAGIDGLPAKAWEADLKGWREVVEINLFGSFYCAREALKRMVPQKSGVIVNMTSVHEVIAWTGFSAYTASKAGLSMLTKTLAQEAAPYGVRVVSVAPGAIKTPINRTVWNDPAGLADLNEKIPLDRMGSRDEIARMVVVLASDTASYVTGTTIVVDGGMTDYPDFAHGG